MNITVGSVVKSTAGKDKDGFFALLELIGDRALIADGKRRKVESPKPKNLKHLRATNTVFDLPLTNKELKRSLKAFGGNAKEE